jgi:hypothetical protein
VTHLERRGAVALAGFAIGLVALALIYSLGCNPDGVVRPERLDSADKMPI